MIRNRHAHKRMPRLKSPGWMFRTRSVHRFIRGTFFRNFPVSLRCGRCCGTYTLGRQDACRFRNGGRISRCYTLRGSPLLRRRLGGIEKHYLLVQIHSDQLVVATDFQCGRPATRVVAAEHAGVDQEDFIIKARANAAALLYRVSYYNVCGLVTLQELAGLRCTLFFAPLVVAAKPKWAINAHAEPISLL